MDQQQITYGVTLTRREASAADAAAADLAAITAGTSAETAFTGDAGRERAARVVSRLITLIDDIKATRQEAVVAACANRMAYAWKARAPRGLFTDDDFPCPERVLAPYIGEAAAGVTNLPERYSYAFMDGVSSASLLGVEWSVASRARANGHEQHESRDEHGAQRDHQTGPGNNTFTLDRLIGRLPGQDAAQAALRIAHETAADLAKILRGAPDDDGFLKQTTHPVTTALTQRMRRFAADAGTLDGYEAQAACACEMATEWHRVAPSGFFHNHTVSEAEFLLSFVFIEAVASAEGVTQEQQAALLDGYHEAGQLGAGLIASMQEDREQEMLAATLAETQALLGRVRSGGSGQIGGAR